jgi:hypothetical protein
LAASVPGRLCTGWRERKCATIGEEEKRRRAAAIGEEEKIRGLGEEMRAGIG